MSGLRHCRVLDYRPLRAVEFGRPQRLVRARGHDREPPIGRGRHAPSAARQAADRQKQPGRARRRAIDELGAGSLVLIDVYTAKDVFHSSLSAFGYQASLAKLQAEGYAVPTS